MGWQNVFASVLQAGNTTVINAAGIFVYAGVPAHGNLIVSIATAAGTDAQGNTFPQGLNVTQGQISGPDYIINSAGIFVYSGTPANGNLIVSVAGAAGSDAFGNPYPEGLNVTQGQISGNGYIITTAGFFFYSGTPAAGNLIYSVAHAQGTDQFGNSYLGGGDTVYDNVNNFALNTSGFNLTWFAMTPQPGATFTQAATFTATGVSGLIAMFGGAGITFQDTNSNGAFTWTVNSNNIPLISVGDGNPYTTGRFQTGQQAIPVPSTTFVGFRTFSVEVGITYDLYVRIGYVGNQNAGTPVIGWHGGSIAMPNSFGYTTFNFVANAIYNNVVPGDRTGPALTTGAMMYETRLRFVATATGTLTIAGACGVAGDTWNMLFCDLAIRPIS